MASRAFSLIFSLLAITATFIFAPALATDFMVEDEKGWALDVDYQAWAKSKTFNVGDKLIFKYEKGSHNVHIVDGKQFKECEGSGTKVLESGNDTVVLRTPGEKWYICGVGHHWADRKMHMAIDVSASSSPPPPPPASSSVVVTTNPYACLIAAELSFSLTTGLTN